MAMVSYECDGKIATIRLDDGKVNALSPAMQLDINEALDRAEADKAVVILTGNEKALSAGFDLGIITTPGPEAFAMLRGGFELSCRLLAFPTPVVIAASGHAIAMGFFLLQSGDYRIGIDKPVKLVANEVAIGMTLPWAAIEITRHRLTKSAFTRMLNLADPIAPADAVAAGALDRLVAPDQLLPVAREMAESFALLDMAAHKATKDRTRADAITAIRSAIDAEFPIN
jgi:enoyl-CoA hydratase/carnithine racemase